MTLAALLLSSILLAFSGIPGVCSLRASQVWQRRAETASLFLALTASAIGLFAALAFLLQTSAPEVFPTPAEPYFLLDATAAFFLLSLFFVGAMCSWYGWGYFTARTEGSRAHLLRLTFGIMLGALVMVFVSAHTIVFLIAWEIMALSAFFLIMTQRHQDAEAEKAGFLYLIATHTGTLGLLGFFALLSSWQGNLFFPTAALDITGASAAALLLTALFGFGLKAGIMPLHIWLPSAHASAPSHVSAMLSGVMIKTGIYGLIRASDCIAILPLWWGGTLLLLGAASCFFGVAYALAQHDMKRLLAYHSVENIGIILIGLALYALGKTYNNQTVAILGLAGALLHVLNHGLFKSLLFLSAGSIIHMGGTREINAYGGILKRAPWTGIAFLGGAAAICALPPLNGFVSEWFVYLSLFEVLGQAGSLPLPALLVAGVLAMAGALALACFVKVFGTLFLGQPRHVASERLHDPVWSMRLPMVALLLACAAIGLLPVLTLPLLAYATNDTTGVLLPLNASIRWFSITGAILWVVVGGATWALVRSAQSAPKTSTWGCGYLHPSTRMQYTASSFAQMLLHLFRWGVGFGRTGGSVHGAFAQPTTFHIPPHDKVLDRMLAPAVERLLQGTSLVKSWLTQGLVGIYLLYIALTLAVLLFWTLGGRIA